MTFEKATEKVKALEGELSRVLADLEAGQANAEVLRAQIEAVKALASKTQPAAEPAK